MANRYFTNDQTKWFGPTHIGPGPGDNAGKRITKFIFDGPEGSAVARLGSAYRNAIETVNGRARNVATWKRRRDLPILVLPNRSLSMR